MTNKSKLALTVLLVLSLVLLVIALGFGLIMLIVTDILSLHSHGFISLLAFVVAAFILGWSINKVVNQIQKIWE